MKSHYIQIYIFHLRNIDIKKVFDYFKIYFMLFKIFLNVILLFCELSLFYEIILYIHIFVFQFVFFLIYKSFPFLLYVYVFWKFLKRKLKK